jgi:hypothetical protein
VGAAAAAGAEEVEEGGVEATGTKIALFPPPLVAELIFLHWEAEKEGGEGEEEKVEEPGAEVKG